MTVVVHNPDLIIIIEIRTTKKSQDVRLCSPSNQQKIQ